MHIRTIPRDNNPLLRHDIFNGAEKQFLGHLSQNQAEPLKLPAAFLDIPTGFPQFFGERNQFPLGFPGLLGEVFEKLVTFFEDFPDFRGLLAVCLSIVQL